MVNKITISVGPLLKFCCQIIVETNFDESNTNAKNPKDILVMRVGLSKCT